MTGPIEEQGVEVLVFDLGGVLVDFDFRRCTDRWAASAGRTPDDVLALFTFDAAYEDHERGAIDAAVYFDHLRTALEVDLADEQLLEGWTDIFLGVNSEVADLLDEAARTFPLYAFTNTNPSHQAAWSKRFARELEVFEAIFVSSELGRRKPEREAFELVASLIGVPASSILFFDDTMENVLGAREAGMQAVHVTSAESVRAALASLTVAASAPAGPPHRAGTGPGRWPELSVGSGHSATLRAGVEQQSSGRDGATARERSRLLCEESSRPRWR